MGRDLFGFDLFNGVIVSNHYGIILFFTSICISPIGFYTVAFFAFCIYGRLAAFCMGMVSKAGWTRATGGSGFCVKGIREGA